MSDGIRAEDGPEFEVRGEYVLVTSKAALRFDCCGHWTFVAVNRCGQTRCVPCDADHCHADALERLDVAEFETMGVLQ